MTQRGSNIFVSSLLSTRRRGSSPDPLTAFRPLIGAWEWTGTDYFEDGRSVPTSGRWIFQEVLNGNAVQDVFIFDDPQKSAQRNPYAEYGTTLRFPVGIGETWKAVFVGPMNKVVRLLDATVAAGTIVHVGTNDKGDPIRWTFFEINERSFRWRGEYSPDAGTTWILYEELEAARKQG